MALFWRVFLAVMLVNLAVLSIFVGLATLQFATINSDLVGERLAVLAGRTAAPFESAARIGLPLSTVRNAGALLERARQTDYGIRAIQVFDAAGQIVHSTDQPAPVMIPPQVAAARVEAGGAALHLETEGGFLNVVEIHGRDGVSAGGILIAYPDVSHMTQIRAMGAELAIAAIGILLVSALLSGFLLRIGLRRQIRTFDAIDGDISAFERGAWRSAALATGASEVERSELRELLDSAEARYRSVGGAISATRKGAR